MPNIGPAPDNRSISASARPPVIVPDGRLCSVGDMVRSLCGEGAAQTSDELAGTDTFAKAERRGAGVDPADDAVLVGGARVADAGACRRNRRGRDAACVERRQTRGAGFVNADS